MATEKLAEGIRKFADDTQKLEQILTEKFSNYSAPKESAPESKEIVAEVKDIPHEAPVKTPASPPKEQVPALNPVETNGNGANPIQSSEMQVESSDQQQPAQTE